jgi:hypothetical protein
MSPRPRLRLGTRASPLARWQAEWVAARLAEYGTAVELVPIATQGDATTGPLAEAGGVGVFTKEIQRALLEGRIDLAVHSLKDLPTEVVPGLALAAVPPRESPFDALVTRHAARLADLPLGAQVGTGSLRRRAQLLRQRPDLVMLDVRGNAALDWRTGSPKCSARRPESFRPSGKGRWGSKRGPTTRRPLRRWLRSMRRPRVTPYWRNGPCCAHCGGAAWLRWAPGGGPSRDGLFSTQPC